MKLAPCSASSAPVLRVTEREGTNGAPCLGVALAVGSAFWFGVSTLLVFVA